MSAVKLYRVQVEVTLYALAEDADAATYDANDHAVEALQDRGGDTTVDVTEVTDIEKVPDPWRTSQPYGEHEDLTIAQWFERDLPEPEPVKDTWTLDMFGKRVG